MPILTEIYQLVPYCQIRQQNQSLEDMEDAALLRRLCVQAGHPAARLSDQDLLKIADNIANDYQP